MIAKKLTIGKRYYWRTGAYYFKSGILYESSPSTLFFREVKKHRIYDGDTEDMTPTQRMRILGVYDTMKGAVDNEIKILETFCKKFK